VTPTLFTIAALLGFVVLVLGAAPTPTARGTPYGHRLKDGFRSFVTFAANPKLSAWETADGGVQPTGADGGDKINTTVMLNQRVVTHAAGQLIDFTDGEYTFAWDPKVVTQLIAIINVEGAITYTYPNGDTECFFGYCKGYTRNPLKRNEMPTGRLMIVCTNVDPINDTEEVPVITLSGGT
jgi:hypothetical protein